MSGHFAVPALTGVDDVPSTLAGEVMSQLLRSELGFEGVTITDALDMKALDQGPNQVLDVLAALRAGVDLLLLAADPVGRERVTSGVLDAPRPVAGGRRRSLTLVRDEARNLPLRIGPKSASLRSCRDPWTSPRPTPPPRSRPASPPRCAPSTRAWTSWSSDTRPTTRRSPRRRGAPPTRPRSSSGRSPPSQALPRRTSSMRCSRPAGPSSPQRFGPHGTCWRTRTLGPTCARIRSCRIRSKRCASALVGRLDPSGKLPVPLGDLYPVGHGL